MQVSGERAWLDHRPQKGCPCFIFSCTNILMWDPPSTHYVSVHGFSRPAIWLLAACFSAASYPAEKFYWKVSAHFTYCGIVVKGSGLHKWLCESHKGITEVTGRFFSSSFMRVCSDMPNKVVQSPGNELCAPICSPNANKQVNHPSVVMFQLKSAWMTHQGPLSFGNRTNSAWHQESARAQKHWGRESRAQRRQRLKLVTISVLAPNWLPIPGETPKGRLLNHEINHHPFPLFQAATKFNPRVLSRNRLQWPGCI